MSSKIFMCLILSFVLCRSSYAELQKFDNVSVNVPNGWSAEQKEQTILLKSDSSKASMEIFFGKINEGVFSDIVEKLYIEREGVDLEQDDDGDYSFNFKNNLGSESIALITGTDDYYLLISMTGFEDETVQPDLESILESIDWDEK